MLFPISLERIGTFDANYKFKFLKKEISNNFTFNLHMYHESLTMWKLIIHDTIFQKCAIKLVIYMRMQSHRAKVQSLLGKKKCVCVCSNKMQGCISHYGMSKAIGARTLTSIINNIYYSISKRFSINFASN